MKLLPGKDDLPDTKQAAALLHLKVKTLELWRGQKKGPQFYRLSHRCVRYKVADLTEWLERQRVETAA